jgi:hypothetical protein
MRRKRRARREAGMTGGRKQRRRVKNNIYSLYSLEDHHVSEEPIVSIFRALSPKLTSSSRPRSEKNMFWLS